MAKRHDLQGFAKKTIAVNTKWLLAEKGLPQPIDKLHLWTDQGRLEVVAIIVRKGNETREIMHGDVPDFGTLPLEDADDELLENLLSEHESDGEIGWGDYFALPESIYRMEMIRCAHAVAEQAKKKGIRFSPKAKIGIRMEDEDYEKPEAFASAARDELKNLDPKLARALVGLFYADVDESGLLSKPKKKK